MAENIEKILSRQSNILTKKCENEDDLVLVNEDSDLECCLSDVDASDSELESLASECSTMSAVSENSSVGTGGDTEGGDGVGKKKRRGEKKDRRKAHDGKCSKDQHRMSDLSLSSNTTGEINEGRRSRSSSKERLKTKSSSGTEKSITKNAEVQREKRDSGYQKLDILPGATDSTQHNNLEEDTQAENSTSNRTVLANSPPKLS